MHIKFLAHGTGSGQKAASYLTGPVDHTGEVRAEVRVLRGNPALCGELADSLNFVEKYTSGVIAFAIEDAPTDDELEAVLDDFERVAYAGLEKDQYTFSAVLHVESDGSKHIHVFAPRVELTTGKSLNIAPPGWEKSFDPLRDMYNHEKGWARPDDPDRRRLLEPGKWAQIDAARLREGLKLEPDARRQIHDWMMARVESGEIQNRAQVMGALREIGTINREGKDYISIRIEEQEKPIRLKGGLYEREFDVNAVLASQRATEERSGGRAEPDHGAAESARRSFEGAIERRTGYNADRYQRDSREAPAMAPEVGREPAPDGVQRLNGLEEATPPAPARQPDPQRRDDPRRSGLELVESAVDSRTDATRNDAGVRPVLRDTSREVQRVLQGVKDDGTRTTVVAAIEGVERSARQSEPTLRSASEATREASERAERSNRSAQYAGKSLGAGIAVMKQNNADELERFKREISLPDVMTAYGYAHDEKQSTRAYAVMRRGDEKLIVTTAKDGHGVFINPRDEKQSGSVIDFMQKEHDANLGKVRKELRGWLDGCPQPSTRRPPPEERIEKPKPVPNIDTALIDARYRELGPYRGTYLELHRHLSPATVKAFDVRQDERGNAVFPHKDNAGLTTGWELKNHAFTAFATGGQKALMTASPDGQGQTITKVVVTESAIDAMSYYELKHTPGSVYVSVGGSMNEQQKEQLTKLLAGVHKSYPSASIAVATDKDEAGEKLAKDIGAMAPETARIEREAPAKGKDWNEQLQAAKPLSEQQQLRKEMEGLRVPSSQTERLPDAMRQAESSAMPDNLKKRPGLEL